MLMPLLIGRWLSINSLESTATVPKLPKWPLGLKDDELLSCSDLRSGSGKEIGQSPADTSRRKSTLHDNVN